MWYLIIEHVFWWSWPMRRSHGQGKILPARSMSSSKYKPQQLAWAFKIIIVAQSSLEHIIVANTPIVNFSYNLPKVNSWRLGMGYKKEQLSSGCQRLNDLLIIFKNCKKNFFKTYIIRNCGNILTFNNQ